MNKISELLKTAEFKPEKLTCDESDQVLTSNDLMLAFEKNLFSYDGLTEDKGKNRSDWVDDINKWIGVPLGSPYCLSALLFNLKMLEPQYAVKFDLPIYAGTQLFWMATLKQYRVSKPSRFCIGIMRSKLDPSKGHAVYCKSGPDAKGFFETFEFNTNRVGSRDGEGAMSSVRNVAGSNTMTVNGFIDLSKCWHPL